MYTFTTSLGITEVEQRGSEFYIGRVKIPKSQVYSTIEEANINLYKDYRLKYINRRNNLQEQLTKLDNNFQQVQIDIDVENLKKLYPEEFICI